ncbi:MAG: protein kinase [Acidobacteriota bacterium]
MPSRVTVTCPSCSTRLQLRLPAGVSQRVKVRCSVCETAFLVRRPGAPKVPVPPDTAAPGTPSSSGGPAAGGGSAGSSAPSPAVPPRRADSQQKTLDVGSAPGIPAPPDSSAPSIELTAPGLLPGDPSAGSGARAFSPRRALEVDTVLAQRYRIVRFLAEGGMGEVYEAEDLELAGRVALKTVRPEAARDQLAMDRFRREIQLARRVTHPNICRIYDVSRHVAQSGEELLFLSMELLPGNTLAQRIQDQGPLGVEEALPLVQQMADGLQAAHQVGVIHRDFKSANVMLVPAAEPGGSPRAVITDFGLARGAPGDGGASALTLVDSVIGTPAYMAPEQVRGDEITAAVDIYALGVVLFEMITGQMPFQGENALSTAVKRLQEPAPSPRLHVPDLDPRWEAVILRCLEQEASARYAEAPQVVTDLKGSGVSYSFASNPAAGPSGGAPWGAPGPGSQASRSQPSMAGGSAPGAAASHPSMADPSPSHPSMAHPSMAHPSMAHPSMAHPSMAHGEGMQAPGSHPSLTSSVHGAPSPSGQHSVHGAFPAAAGGAGAGAKPRSRSRDRFTIVGLLVLILLTALFGWRQVARWQEGRLAMLGDEALLERAISQRPTVAVLALENLSSNVEDDWIGTAAAELLGAELGSGDLRTVPAESIARARRELVLESGSSLDAAEDPSTTTSLLTAVGAQYLVDGTFLATAEGDQGGTLRMDVALQDRGGSPLASVSRTGGKEELLSLVAAVGEELRQALNANPGGERGALALAALPEDPGARRLYVEGLEQLRAQHPLEARDLLREAVAAAPESALARAALADAWAALGHLETAQQEARQALTLAAGLPQEEALWIEARYLELSGEWLPAAELYRQLWHAFPDDPDYALKVADSLTNAGRGDEALSTLSVLRRLVTELEDPRLDLAEARAAAAVGDFERQLSAAEAAAVRAQEAGAGLLRAEARVLEASALRNLGGNDEAALAAAREGESLYAAAGDQPGLAFALTNLANLHVGQADFDSAAEGFGRAAEIYRERGDGAGLARSQNALALVAKRQGRLDEAQTLYEQCLELCRELGNELMEAPVLNNFASLMVAKGKLERADELFQRALELQRRGGNRSGEATVLDNIGVVQRKQGQVTEAVRVHREALTLHGETENRPAEVATLSNLARALVAGGEIELASLEAEKAVALARELDQEGLLARALEAQGEALAAKGELEAAADNFRRAVEIYRQRGDSARVARAQLGLARRQLELGELIAAQEQASLASDALRSEGAVDDLATALAVEARSIVLQGDLDSAEERLEEAQRQADVSSNAETRGEVLLARAAVEGRRGRLGQALDELDEALRLLGESSHRSLQLSLRLARLEAALEAGRGDAEGERSLFEGLAREQGFELLAQRAAEL